MCNVRTVLYTLDAAVRLLSLPCLLPFVPLLLLPYFFFEADRVSALRLVSSPESYLRPPSSTRSKPILPPPPQTDKTSGNSLSPPFGHLYSPLLSLCMHNVFSLSRIGSRNVFVTAERERERERERASPPSVPWGFMPLLLFNQVFVVVGILPADPGRPTTFSAALARGERERNTAKEFRAQN